MINHSLRVLLLAVIAMLTWPSPGSAAQTGSAHKHPQTYDRFIVQFKPGSLERGNGAARQKLLDASGRLHGAAVTQLRRMAIGADVIRTSRKLDAESAKAFMMRLRHNPAVAFVEIDRRVTATLVPNDTYYAGYQWHYFDPVGGINLPAAWDLATGNGVVVAVIDTGITPHTDLNANVVTGYDFISDPAAAVDGNGRDADPNDPGDWTLADACDVGEPATDSSWHGTHVAGTVAAVTNNAKGVAGVAFNAKVMPLRVLGHCGGSSSDVDDAIVWAAGGSVPGVPNNPNPVEVINLSLGGEGPCSAADQAAINTAVAAGVVVVASAGNDDLDASAFSPANCQSIIVVAATGKTGARSSYSNFGPAIDVSAPGGDAGDYIASTINTGTTVQLAEGYGLYQGTSMAAPHVSGTAALMQSAAVSTPAAVEAVLKGTARALPVACPEGCGAGIINAAAAIGSATGGALTVNDQTMTEGDAGTKLFTFTVSLSKAMPTPVTFNIATANGTATAGSDYLAVSLTGQSIAAGATSKTFNVTVNGDTVAEQPNETFTINVSNVVGINVADAQGLGTIVNDDAAVLSNGVPFGPIAGTIGQSFYYTLDVPAGQTSVTFSTTGPGGGMDADLYVKRGSIPTINDNDCYSESSTATESCSIPSPVAGTYYVLVYAYTSFSGVSLTGQYQAATLPTISIADVSLAEGNSGTQQATFTVSLSQAAAGPVTFDIATDYGTASPGSDFVSKATPGQSIAAGQTSAPFAVTINGDTNVEDNETFTVNLANVSGATVLDAQAQGRIINDDMATLSIDDVSLNEGGSGTASTATFVIHLSRPMPNPVTFDIATSNGTASAPVDYVARSQLGRYLDAGRTSLPFEVNVTGDATAETNETINVTISNVTGAILGDGAAIGTILNDDAALAPVQASVQHKAAARKAEQ